MIATITTSDGFTASGHAVDAADAAAEYALLDEFSRFLELRVGSQNLWLLRRLLAEFFCHCETSLRQMAAQGCTQIAVMPLELDDHHGIAEAQRMLETRRLRAADSGRASCVFAYLVTRLRTTRLALLMNFFVEFCQGNDDALREYIDDGVGFVTILPSLLPDGRQPHASTDGIVFQSEEPLEMPPPPRRLDSVTPTHRHKTKDATSRKIQPVAKALASAPALPSPDALARVPFNRPSALVRDYKMFLINEVGKIEAQRPWRKVYTETYPPLPFDEAKYPILAKQLRTFWTRYGRAVWERSFWVPHCEAIDTKVTNKRKGRQRGASSMFERIILACFEQFGPRFFYKLDREHHPGWWYRGIFVDLMALAALDGATRCIEFVKSQQFERFPDCGHALPLRSANAGVILSQYNSKVVSEAMWVQSNKGSFEEMRQQYAEYRAKKLRKEAKKDKKHKQKQSPSEPVVHKKPSREELRAASAAARPKAEPLPNSFDDLFLDDDDDEEEDDGDDLMDDGDY